MKKFERRKYEFDLYGEKKSISFPTVAQWNEYKKDILKEDNDDHESMVKFLGSLGFVREDVESMEDAHLGELVEDILTKKK